MSKTIITILAICTLVACKEKSADLISHPSHVELGDDELNLDAESETPRTSPPPLPPVVQEVPDEESKDLQLDKGSKIIKVGYMKFEVGDLNNTKQKIDSLLKVYKGYYENENFTNSGYMITYSLTLRIPNADFEPFVKHLEKGVGHLQSKNINAQDVTEEYVDVNIRLENNLAYLRRYKEILKSARSVKEILEVEEKIRVIEEEIDSKKGRIKYLDNQVSYSTLNLELNEIITSKVTNNPNLGRRIINAFTQGIHGLLDVIVGLVYMWPLWLIIAGFWFGWRKWRKRRI